MYVRTRALQVCQDGGKMHWGFDTILFQIMYGPGKSVNENERINMQNAHSIFRKCTYVRLFSLLIQSIYSFSVLEGIL